MHSPTPALPADALVPETPNGAPQRITLRRSVTLRTALLAFMLIASAAIQSCVAPHLGAWRALPLSLAAFALLALFAIRRERNLPAALKVGPEGLSVWNHAGLPIAQGRITGCSQWTGKLLVLAFAADGARAHTLLIAADMLPAAIFRELAVLGRRGAQA